MKHDIVLAGVGGQGVLSIAAIIAAAALREGRYVKQTEVHGMAQRGGAVSAHLRLSDRPIWSEIIPHGEADLILSMEPVEALRYVSFLSPGGSMVSAVEPVLNTSDYPPVDDVLGALRTFPHAVLVDTTALARRAGSPRVANVVLVGAACTRLPLAPESVEGYLREAFAPKGREVVEANVRAFRFGREARECMNLC